MKKCKEIRKRVIAMLCAVTMTAVSIPFAFSLQAEATEELYGEGILEENDGNLNRIPWNNSEINADISAGFNAITVVLDYNGDDKMDIMSIGRGVDSLGTVVYLGTDESQNPNSENYMVLGAVEKLRGNNTEAKENNWGKDPVTVYEYDSETGKYGSYKDTTMVIGGTYYKDVADFVSNGFKATANNSVTRTGSVQQPTKIGDKDVLDVKGENAKNPVQYYWLYDVDGDDNLDLVWFIDQFHGEYGGIKNDKFDDNGVWGDDNYDGIGDDDGDGDDDPQHCWVVWLPNEGTNEAPVYNGEGKPLRTEEGLAVECYGQCDPQMQDWDADGDLDIICGSFIDEITYFENTGAKDDNGAPIYAKGRAIPLSSDDAGENVTGELKAELCVLELTNCDWNKDGYMDLVVTEEDGRCFLVQNTGKTDNNGTPIMVHKGYFKAPAGNLQAGCLPTPASVDWDGDGDEDIICGNSAGFLNFIENVTPEGGDLTNPSWGAIRRLKTPDGKDYRIQAGYNGSTQGPNEKVWGYTMVSVADWDGDGVLDIMHNNVWGKVLWHKGIKGSTDTIGYAQPVEVEWSGETPKPKWLWWNPEGDELVTQWRTTPFMVDLPLDEDGDGVAEGDGLMDLVMMDHEGYLAFYQRYQDSNGVLKLKEGQRIFMNKYPNATSGLDARPFRLNDEQCGDSGKNSCILVDWDQDGDLDLFKTKAAVNTPIYFENISKVPGKYEFCKNGEVGERTLKQHDATPAACDWNKDGIPDLIVTNEDGFFYYLENNMDIEVEEEVEDEIEVVDPYAYLQDYLMAHWDFEGDAVEALKDKSNATNNDLTIYDANDVAQATDDIIVKDGVATIKGGASLRAMESTNLNITKELTIFMKVKVDSLGSGQTTLVSKGNISKAYSVQIRNNTGSTWGVNPGSYKWAGSSNRFVADEWKEMAVVISYTDTTMNLDYYLSNDSSTASANDFNHTSNTKENSPALNKTSGVFRIGNVGESGTLDTSVIREFADIQIYNKALTAEELNSLLPDESVKDALVAHWDFEGATETERLKDKAPYDGRSDDMTMYEDNAAKADTTKVSVNNGVATIQGSGGLRAVGSKDTVDLNIKAPLTIFMKVKVDSLGESDETTVLLAKGGKNPQYGIEITNQTNRTWGALVGTGNTWGDSEGARSEFKTNEWQEVAVVIGADGKTVDYYLSKGSSTASIEDFIHTTNTAKNAVSTTGADFRLENLVYDATLKYFVAASSSVTREYDDVRIYNKALTAEQICNILPATTSEEPLPDEEPETPVRGELVSHWDFEGDTLEEQLRDKAEKGTTEDNLALRGTDAATNITFVTDANTGRQYAQFKGKDTSLFAAASEDISQTGAMTVFVRLKAGNGNHGIIDAGGSVYRLTKDSGIIKKFITNANYGNDWYPGNQLDGSVWREVALVIDKNEYGIVNYKLLVSKGEGTTAGSDFIVYEEGSTCGTVINACTMGLLIGNCFNSNYASYTRRFDDVRIYNYALTADELAGIMPTSGTTTSPYLRDLKNDVGLAFRPTDITPSTVNTSATTVSFTPEADDANQVIKLRGETVESGTKYTYYLVPGVNEFVIEVTNGTASKTYTIKVNCTVPTTDDLQAAIDEAKAIEKGAYTDSSYQALNTAITFAEGKVDGTIEDRKVASETLATAVAELTTRLQMADLRELADKATEDGKDVTALMSKVNALTAPSSKEITAVYNELLKVAMGVDNMILQPEVTDSIAMVYKSTITSGNDVSVTFTVDGKTTEADVTKVGNEYTFTYPNVYAQDMAQTIEATLTVGDYSRVYKTSFLDYCVDVMNDDKTDVELKDLIVDLVKYGESVQVFRGDVANRNELLTNKFTARQKFISTYTLRDDLWTTMGSAVEVIPENNVDVNGYVSQAVTGTVDDNYKWSSMRLVLKDEVNLRCKFTANDISKLDVKVTINETSYTYNKDDFKKVADNTYELDFGEIYANEYGVTVTFEFVNNGEMVGQKLNYSVNTYLYNKRSSTTENLPELLLAIYKYGLSANAFQSSSVQ